jgi:hypothetical protein
MFACRDVESRANNYLLERFEYVAKTEEFLKLSASEVEHFLSMDDIIVKSEESIFECILRWIRKDPPGRADSFDRLVRCVRFPLVPDHYVDTEILPSELVQKSRVCQQLIQESQLMRRRRRYNNYAASSSSLVPATADSRTTAGSSAGERQPQYRGSNQLLFLQCSNTSPWLKTPPVLYDFKKSSWSTLGGPHSPCRYREDSTFVFHDGSVLAVGGEYTNDGTEGGGGAGLPLVGGPANGGGVGGGLPLVGGAAQGAVQVMLGKKRAVRT